MADLLEEFEITNVLGITAMLSGSVNASGINLPTVATTDIEEVAIRCAIDQPFASRLEFSYDGGTTWCRLAVGEAREDMFRGSIKQIRIRSAGSLATCNYEVIMNRGQT